MSPELQQIFDLLTSMRTEVLSRLDELSDRIAIVEDGFIRANADRDWAIARAESAERAVQSITKTMRAEMPTENDLRPHSSTPAPDEH